MEKDSIAIIDVDSIAFAIGWGNKIPDKETGEYKRDEKGRLLYKDKSEKELINSADFIMNEILTESMCTHYIGFIKGKSTAKHRYQAKPDYKSNRPKESPNWWEFVRGYLISNFNIHSVDNIEVDDAVNITRLHLENSFVIAIDKDLLNLEGTHYNWRTKEWISTNKEQEIELFWADMIIGQPGDGVSGIPGKGQAYAKKIKLNSTSVLYEYIKFYGEYLGIQEFYKNYTCLKILDVYEGFEIPEIIKYLPKNSSGTIEGDSISLW